MTKHIMIDLETLSTEPNAVILAIGAVAFDGETGKRDIQRGSSTFYATVKIQSCLDRGMIVEGNTIKWWGDQSAVARTAAFVGSSHIGTALRGLSEFIDKRGEDGNRPCVWGNDSVFDIGILNSAYKACCLESPWAFWKVRCYRTISKLVPKEFFPWDGGTKHHALHDAEYQTDRLLAIAAKLNLNLN